jgi:hypothetical protein
MSQVRVILHRFCPRHVRFQGTPGKVGCSVLPVSQPITRRANQLDQFFPIRRLCAVQNAPESDAPKNSFREAIQFVRVLRLFSRKYFTSVFRKYVIVFARPAPDPEGRFAIVTNVGRGTRWTLAARETKRVEADEQRRVVLIPRCWDQVSRDAFAKRRRQSKPGLRGEHVISRKPLRRECRIASAEPVCSCAFLPTICARDRGCSVHPAFPAPSFFRAT